MLVQFLLVSTTISYCGPDCDRNCGQMANETDFTANKTQPSDVQPPVVQLLRILSCSRSFHLIMLSEKALKIACILKGIRRIFFLDDSFRNQDASDNYECQHSKADQPLRCPICCPLMQ